MKRGLEALQVAILMAVVTLASAIVAQFVLKPPAQPKAPGVARVIAVMSDAGYCNAVYQALKDVYKPFGGIKMLTVNGDLNLTLIVRVLREGILSGIKVKTSKGLVLVQTKQQPLPPGLYLICVNATEPLNVTVDPASVSLVGFQNLQG